MQQILQVPNYLIFEPDSGTLEVHRLDESGQYQLCSPEENQRYWLPEMDLFIGVWEGKRENRDSYWLRWWDATGKLLLWGVELVQQERQAKETAEQQALLERQAKETAEQQVLQERQAKENAQKQLEQLQKKLQEAGIELQDSE